MCEICHSNPCRPQCPKSDEPEQVYTCDICEAPIYDGECYYRISDDMAICEDCINDSKRIAEAI